MCFLINYKIFPKIFFHKTPKKPVISIFFQKNFMVEIEWYYEGLKYTKNKEGLESTREPGSDPGEYK